MKTSFTFLLLFLGLTHFAWGQCDGQLECDNADVPGVEMQIAPFTPPVVCGEAVTVMVTIAPTAGAGPIDVAFPCNFIVDLDVAGTGVLEFSGLGPSDAGFTVVGGIGTSVALINYSGAVTDDPVTFSLLVSAGCSFFDSFQSLGGSTALLNNQISICGCYESSEGAICLSAESDPFEVSYNVVTLGEGNSVTTVDIGEPFDVSIDLEVTGNFCQNDYTIALAASSIVSFQDASATVTLNCGPWNNLQIPAAIQSNPLGGTSLVIDPSIIGLTDIFCSQNFDCGMGEVVLTLQDLVMLECPANMSTPLTFSVQNCSPPQANTSCFDNTGNLLLESESTIFVQVFNGNPKLEITHSWNTELDFCGDQITVEYTITNTSDDVAYNVLLNITPYQWMTIDQFGFAGGVGSNLNNLAAFNNTYAAGQPLVVSTAPNELFFDFQQANTPALGFEDINQDGFFGELSPGESVSVRVKMHSSCVFAGDMCQSNIDVEALNGVVSWNNQCGSFDQLPESTAVAGPLQAQGPPAKLLGLNCEDDPDLEDGDLLEMQLCVEDWVVFSGFDGPLFDLGDFAQFLDISYDLSSGLELTSATYEGQPAAVINTGNGYLLDLGDVGLPLSGGCFDFTFVLDCNQASQSMELPISFQLYGEWANCGDDCQVLLGCAGQTFYTFCDCYPLGANWDCDYDNEEVPYTFEVRRTNAPECGNACAAYECDPVQMKVKRNLKTPYTGMVYGGFSNELFNPSFPFFDDFSVQVLIDGQPSAASVNPVTFTDPSNPEVTIQLFGLAIDQPQPGGVEIEFIIDAIVQEDAIENFPLDVFAYTIETFRGIITTDLNQYLSVPGTGEIFSLYRIESELLIAEGAANCNDGINLPPAFFLTYHGATPFEDFPCENRLTTRFDKKLFVEVIPPNLQIHTINGIPVNGGPTNFLTDFVNNYLIFDPPSTSSSITGVSQALVLGIDGAMNCDEEEITINYELYYEDDIFATPESECIDGFEPMGSFTIPVANGTILTHPINPNIVTYAGNSFNGNSDPLSVWIEADNFDSENTWIQFQYPAGSLNLEALNFMPLNFGIENNGAFDIAWFVFDESMTEVGAQFDFDYEVLTCDPNPLEVEYLVGKSCYGGALPPVIDFNDPQLCTEGGTFTIETVVSGLAVDMINCGAPAEFCNVVYYAVLVENTSLGDVSDILVELNLDPGLSVVEAYYQYPFTGNGNSCETTGHEVLDPALVYDDLLPNGILPGIMSGAGEAERLIHLIIGVQADCDETVVGADGLTITVSGQRNCGEIQEESEAFNLGVFAGECVELEGSLDIDENYDFDCESQTGSITLHLDFNVDLNTLPSGQQVMINFTTSPNIVLSSPSMIAVDPNNLDPQISFTIVGDCTDGFIQAELTSSCKITCGDTYSCQTIEVSLAQDVISFNQLEVSFVSVEDFCNLSEGQTAEVVVSVYNPGQIPPGDVVVTLWWDPGCNQMDLIPLGSQTIVAPAPGSGSEVTVDIVFDDICVPATGCLVASAGYQLNEDGCVCFERTALYPWTCSCPEWELLVSPVPEGFMVYFVQPNGSTEGFEFAYISLDNGNEIEVTENPMFIPWGPIYPGEICFRVYSECCGCPEGYCEFISCQDFGECVTILDYNYTVLDEMQRIVEFNAEVITNLTNPTLNWYVDGDLIGTGDPFTYTFPQPGVFDVCLQVIDPTWSPTCVEEFCQLVEVAVQLAPPSLNAQIELGIVEAAAAFTIFPNPANDWFTLAISADQKMEGVLQILGVSGRKIHQQQLSFPSEGTNTARIELEDLPAGVYLVRYQTGQETFVQKLMIE